MTVLDWLGAKTRYTFEDATLMAIIADRGCNPNDDMYGGSVTEKQRNLMIADTIFTAVVLSPSSTPSLSQSHNGYQKTIGSETDIYQNRKIDFALSIYRMYDDPNAELLENAKQKIKQIPIVDVLLA